ncbi:armadillo-type protein [Syncephalastrum racemosum]|uniref:Eukaryotic translation initiation factor 3 subunit K n=1 Tax=Syncephalastrum racemosum TaxID=13706 RepID=A0A1X2HPD6_SYNRA|nr:armadillo-type protein [Syncephalastrum racemosum]
MAAVHVDRPTPIQSLIDSVERYNPDNVQVLEDYLATQCKNGQYDLQANLALLKLYQFNPQSAKESVIVNVLVKSMTAVPAPDFNLCMYLLAEYAGSESIQNLVSLQQLLEQSRYVQFWSTYASHKALTANVAGFEEAIREVIAKIVAMSYQAIKTTELQAYLALNGDAFNQFCAQKNWEIKDSSVLIPINKDNEAKTVVVRENIKFEQLTKVIGYSNEM